MEKNKPVANEPQEKFRGFDNDILDEEDFEESPDKAEDEKPVVEEGEKPADDNQDEDEKGDESNESDAEKEAKKQSKEENARYAEARRQAEEKARLAKEREAEKAKIKEEAKIEAELGLIKKNPYTNTTIEDEEDLEIYKVQKAIEDEGGDPVADLASRLAKISREKKREQQAKLDAEAKVKAEDEAYIANDIAELRKAYPDVDLASLARDIDYQEFIKGKVKRWTSTELYEGYMAHKNKSAEKSNEDEEEVIAKGGKQITKVPSPQPQGKSSIKNIDEMSDEEYLKNEKAKSVDFFS